MGELRERKREVRGEVLDGNELDVEGEAGVLGGLDLGGLPTVSRSGGTSDASERHRLGSLKTREVA